MKKEILWYLLNDLNGFEFELWVCGKNKIGLDFCIEENEERLSISIVKKN